MKNRTIRLMILQAGFDCNADFAETIGLHESTLSRVLNGRRKLKADQAERMAQALKCSPDILSDFIK